MTQIIKCRTKKGGNSIGVILPAKIVNEENIKPREDVLLEIKGKEGNVLRELAGALKFKESTKEIMKESKRLLESKLL